MSKGDDPLLRPTALSRLVTIGQAKGFLTYDEVNDGMPVSIESSEQIDGWLSVLTREGIEIVDKPPGHKDATVGKQAREAGWMDYDPSWLVELARQQEPRLVWALMKCTIAFVESKAYIHFVHPASPNQPGSEWQFDRNVSLHHPLDGHVVLDVLTDGRIGGLEFIDRL